MSEHTLVVVALAAATALLGAVFGGMSQVMQDWRRRRGARQVAARLIYADLEIAYHHFDELQRKGTTINGVDLRRCLTVWREQAPAFADTVGLGDFHLVAGAFASLATYLSDSSQTDNWILGQTERLDRARRVAWKAGGAPLTGTLETSLPSGNSTYKILPPGREVRDAPADDQGVS